ncbi:MAG: gliding motility lipoprotein GldH [Bacteroidales bacterium]|nr:gliding motility lipoprotein GldH [Bacteroidales bacterium]
MKLKLLLLLGFLASITGGCDKDYFYAKSETIDNQNWPKNEIKGFTFSVEDTISTYHFIINIRNTTEYEFQNLYLFMNTIYPDKSSSRDTLELILAAPSGKWLGKGKGFFRDNLFMFKHNVSLPQKGNYRIEFLQAMRKDTLTGIDEIGLRIQKNQNRS